jgi:hypothetical protein
MNKLKETGEVLNAISDDDDPLKELGIQLTAVVAKFYRPS